MVSIRHSVVGGSSGGNSHRDRRGGSTVERTIGSGVIVIRLVRC